MEASDNESQHSENSNDGSDWMTEFFNSRRWSNDEDSDEEDSVESIFESKAERDYVYSLWDNMERTRLRCGKEFLDKLIKSNDPKDKETLNSTIIKILKNDYDADLQYLISNSTLDLNAKDYEDMTALSVAATYSSIEVVKLLLKNMTDSDVDRYNKENLFTYEALAFLPRLSHVEQTIAVIDLIQEKNIHFDLKSKLAVLDFFIHNDDECSCQNTDISSDELSNNMESLITYGSPTHIKKVIQKIWNDITSGKLKLDMFDFYMDVSRPLSPGILFELYVDQDVKDFIEELFEENIEDGYPFKLDHGIEWKWMECRKLENNLTLQKLLKKHPHETYEHVKNLNFFKICNRYTIAGDYMKGLKAKSLIRHQVLEFIPNFVEELLPTLPDLCFDRIMFYITGLSNEDLFNMCLAAASKKYSKN